MSDEQLSNINRQLQLAAEDLREEVIANALYESIQHNDYPSLTEQEAMR
jgi:hypothetical protein